MSNHVTHPGPAPASILGDGPRNAALAAPIAPARLRALSAEIARLFANHPGRAPGGVRSLHLDADYVVTVLEDCLTATERKLVGDGQRRLVESRRIALAEVMEREFLRAAERTLGRVVLAHRTRILPESGTSFEVFVLAAAGEQS